MKERNTATISQLQSLLPYWLPILGLQSWEIQLDPMTKDHKDYEIGLHGENYYNGEQMQARILIVTPDDFKSSECGEVYNAEATLIHELLHLVLWNEWELTANSKPQRAVLHSKIERIAWALYWCKNGGRK